MSANGDLLDLPDSFLSAPSASGSAGGGGIYHHPHHASHRSPSPVPPPLSPTPTPPLPASLIYSLSQEYFSRPMLEPLVRVKGSALDEGLGFSP